MPCWLLFCISIASIPPRRCLLSHSFSFIDSKNQRGRMASIFEPRSGASSSPPPQKASKQACDNCRRRKIKCNRAQPCDKCQRLLLSCSYYDVLQRKGPKFRTLYPLAPLQTLVSQYPTPPQSITDQASQSELMVPREYKP